MEGKQEQFVNQDFGLPVRNARAMAARLPAGDADRNWLLDAATAWLQLYSSHPTEPQAVMAAAQIHFWVRSIERFRQVRPNDFKTSHRIQYITT
jgi:type VI protein secretion system component VasF